MKSHKIDRFSSETSLISSRYHFDYIVYWIPAPVSGPTSMSLVLCPLFPLMECAFVPGHLRAQFIYVCIMFSQKHPGDKVVSFYFSESNTMLSYKYLLSER